MIRKRPTLKPGDAWNPQKHASQRKARPDFVGKITGTNRRVIGKWGAISGEIWLGRLSPGGQNERSLGLFFDRRKQKKPVSKNPKPKQPARPRKPI